LLARIIVIVGKLFVINRLRDGGAAPDDAAVQVQFLLLSLKDAFFN
jgi:hypothetical protein